MASPPPAPEVASSASASKSPPPAAHVAGPKLASLPGTSIRFDGGDGSAKDKAIKILGAKGEQDGVAAEYQYLDAVFGKGSWKPKGQSLLEEDGRKIDAIDFVRDGHDDTLYFDISDYFGKF